MRDLTGKTALVTGASRGIGRAIAQRLGADGALVAVHYASYDAAAKQTVGAIEQAGGQAFPIRAELGVDGDVDTLFTGLEAGLGGAPLDILVNNAGILDLTPLEQVTPEAFDRGYAVNVRAPFFIIQRALPLLLTHGWPGSVAEFFNVIGPLTDPGAHGGDPDDAFHLVIPSIPGYGFSGPTREPGWNFVRIANAWAELMCCLGYDRYAAQGGDVGALISLTLAGMHPENLAGVHVNFLITPPPDDPSELADLSESEQARLGRMSRFVADLSGYMKLQSTRPQTLSYALTDSPVGQLAWIVEKFREWTDSAKVPEDAVDRDQLLTNVMIYWLTATAGSSAQLYVETAELLPIAAAPPSPPPPRLTVPLGVAIFPHDIFLPVRRFADRAFPKIVHWTEFDRGGHFAAMEEPELFVGDLRAFGRILKG